MVNGRQCMQNEFLVLMIIMSICQKYGHNENMIKSRKGLSSKLVSYGDNHMEYKAYASTFNHTHK